MSYQNPSLRSEARRLRTLGLTYGEINTELQMKIPKSTLSEWCKNVSLPESYRKRIAELNITNFNKARLIGLEVNKVKREELLQGIVDINLPLSHRIKDREIAKIALSMLCLGEASRTRGSFSLGSSDPRIIIIFLQLLKVCFNFRVEKVRCTVQCRADQDTEILEKFWLDVTKIPKRLFYKTRVDPRTMGRPTRKKNYKGVLKVDYFDTRVQIELETLADLVYNRLSKKGPEV